MHADRMQLIHLAVVLINSVLVTHFARCEESDVQVHEGSTGSDYLKKRASKDIFCDLKLFVACNNETLTGERGSIKFYHLSYAEYGPNLNCKWTITVHPEKVIIIYIEELDLEKGCKGGCDTLTISDGDTKVLASFSNISLLYGTVMNSYETTSNTATVTFVSNGDENRGYGFIVNYNSAQKEVKIMCGVPKYQPNVFKLELAPLSVSPHSFPWHVNIFSETKKEVHSCSGTVIARGAILTAAHCFDPELTESDYKVTVGIHSLLAKDANEVTFDISDIFLHPDYDATTLDNDIAIVKISQQLSYNDTVRPVCPAGPRDHIPTESICITTGWPDKPGPDGRLDLTQSGVTVQAMTRCNVPSAVRRSSSICAGFNSPSLNVCNQRAAGGALVCQSGNQWIQYGVMSAGIGCSGKHSPGLFTNIGKYNDWISARMGADCGRPAVAPKIFARIVGGSEVNPHSWPWQISLRLKGAHNCGGSILGNRWILTAAHCFNEITIKAPEQYTIAVGKHNLRLKETTERSYSVERIFTYPKGTDQFLEYDIALVYVTEDIVYNKYVKPVCLADFKHMPDQTCVVTGWGKTQKLADQDSSRIPLSDILNELEVPLISDETCRNAVNRSDQLNLKKMSPDLIVCAGYMDGSKDSCFGDSGGPLVCFDEGEGAWKQVGIVSYGRGCAVKDFPGFYSKVAAYKGWIMSQIASYPAVAASGSFHKDKVRDPAAASGSFNKEKFKGR